MFTGFRTARKWDSQSPKEEQYRLEKKAYLIITVLSVGFILRLLMIPLWFWSLQTMVISIPGAMCLAGVHQINSPFSWISSSLKIILPVFYTYWLILNYLDRQVVTQPFMKLKLRFLVPLGLFIIAETIFDVSFFTAVPPRQVSCCTSLFDIPGEGIPQIFTQTGWIWVVIFYFLGFFIMVEMVWFFICQKNDTLTGGIKWFWNKPIMTFQTLFIALFIIVFILALHTKFSPLFLNLPFHHCVFCLCQQVWDVLLSAVMILMGSFMFIIYVWIVSFQEYRVVKDTLHEKIVALLKWAIFFFFPGMIIISIHLILWL